MTLEAPLLCVNPTENKAEKYRRSTAVRLWRLARPLFFASDRMYPACRAGPVVPYQGEHYHFGRPVVSKGSSCALPWFRALFTRPTVVVRAAIDSLD